MSKKIAALWNGEIAPFDELGRQDTELKNLEKCMRDHLEELRGGQSLELCDKCSNSIWEYVGLCAQNAFADGFSLGVTLTAEAFCRKTTCES